MADFQSIKDTIAALKAEVDAEQAQGATLEQEVADLKAKAAGGLTADQANELAADLDELKSSIAGIVPDEAPGPGTPADPGPPAPPDTSTPGA